MIAKDYRLHGYGELKFVYAKGKTVRSRTLSLRFGPNPRRKTSRLAVVVSKKVTKKSPVRNHIRRRIHEAMRIRCATIEPGYDLVVTVFDQEVAIMSTAKLGTCIDDLLAQAGIAHKKQG